jgi:phosphatidylethanolamine/phosphatidyl-N-methylethanolamine N-methyltransferase
MDGMIFFRAFLKNRKQVGSPFQSSRHVARKICNAIDFNTAQKIIEIGPGLGKITREILKFLKPDAQLVVFEINKDLCEYLRGIQDRRLVIYNASGFELTERFKDKADYVISEIPIATLSPAALGRLYREIKTVLRGTGTCLQLQLSLLSYRKVRHFFRNVRVFFTVLNLPPLFIYCRRDYGTS